MQANRQKRKEKKQHTVSSTLLDKTYENVVWKHNQNGVSWSSSTGLSASLELFSWELDLSQEILTSSPSLPPVCVQGKDSAVSCESRPSSLTGLTALLSEMGLCSRDDYALVEVSSFLWPQFLECCCGSRTDWIIGIYQVLCLLVSRVTQCLNTV